MSNYLVEHYKDLGDGEKIIGNYEVNQEHTKDVWRKHVLHAAKMTDDPEVYADVMAGIEADILIKRRDNGEMGCFKKNGKPNFSKVCSNSTYRANKSIIINAMKEGVRLLDAAGEPVPRSKMQTLTKKAKAGVGPDEKLPTVSDYERAVSYAVKLKNVWGKLDPAEQADISTNLKEFI